MGFCLKLFGLLTVVAAVGLGGFWHFLGLDPGKPEIQDKYWGSGQFKPDDTTIRPFTVKISDTDLNEFKAKLANSRKLTPTLEGTASEYGLNSNYLSLVLNYWRLKYDWRKREALLNEFPQFRTQISGLSIHYIHVKPNPSKLKPGTKVLPILLLPGWPDSAWSYRHIIPLLTEPRQGKDFVFEVISANLPGIGFSEAPSKPGCGPTQAGLIFKKLMDRLGFKKFYIEAGDWGAHVGNTISIMYPESVLGFYNQLCTVKTVRSNIQMVLAYLYPDLYVENETLKQRLVDQPGFLLKASGYFHLQATKPDSLGVALSDSPAGLAAYFLEKYGLGTNRRNTEEKDAGLSNWDMDILLDNLMIYWFGESITTSLRVYKEAFSPENLKINLDIRHVHVPTACVFFPQEILYIPKSILQERYKNIKRYGHMSKGGHFAILEEPSLLANDLWEFVSLLEPPHKPKEESVKVKLTTAKPKIDLHSKIKTKPEETKSSQIKSKSL